MSKIRTYFTPNDYQKCRGEEIRIRKCDVSVESKQKDFLAVADQETCIYKGFKEYDASFIWGQLVGWYKQTVDKPSSSLSADRRGTLSLPDIDTFLECNRVQVSEGSKPNVRKRKSKQKSKKGRDSSSEAEVMP